MAPERLTARRIEAARRADPPHEAPSRVSRSRVPDLPVSKKPAEVYIGSGKGTQELSDRQVPSRVVKIDGVTVQTTKEALSLAAAITDQGRRFLRTFEVGRWSSPMKPPNIRAMGPIR